MVAAVYWPAQVPQAANISDPLLIVPSSLSLLDDGYHLLSTLAYLAAAVVLAALLQRLVDGRFRVPRAVARARWLGGVVTALAVLTALCGLTTDPFLAARHLGHQAREASTHLAVTLPLSFTVLPGRRRLEGRSGEGAP